MKKILNFIFDRKTTSAIDAELAALAMSQRT